VAMFVSDWNYKPHAIEAYDMFPQTAHVESICVLERLIGQEKRNKSPFILIHGAIAK
jgi:hypothetical protein